MTPEKAKPAAPLLEGMPRDQDGPVFAAPWEARAFAMVCGLCEQGRYRWKDFQNYLIAEIAAGEARAKERGGEPPAYYESFYAAGVKLLADQDLLDVGELEKRMAELRG